MAKYNFEQLEWKEIVWPRPFSQEQVVELLAHLAVTSPRGPIVLEARSHGGYVKHMIGADEKYITKLENVFKAHGDIRLYPLEEFHRIPVIEARQLTVSHPGLSLNTDVASAAIRAGLAALADVRGEEESVVQIVLGASYKPQGTPKKLPDPHESWLRTILYGVDDASPDTRKSIKEKNEQHCFQACIRLGIAGRRKQGRLNAIVSAFRTLESAGVHIGSTSDNPQNIIHTKVPWRFPLRLSVKELASFALLPFGEEELLGTQSLHPKVTHPPDSYKEPTNATNRRTFAHSLSVAKRRELSISPEDSLQHTILLGPTGSGKSTAMLNLILSDIAAGRSVLVIDPKTDLVTSILERMPEKRIDDVVIIDPTDPSPVGFNPLSLPGDHTLIADAILAVFKEIFAENWGIRSQDVLSAALLTLMETEGASLLYLPALLTDKNFRRKITRSLKDDIVLKPFWKNYDAMRDSERKQEIAPVLNKIRQFLYRPGLRSVLGQSDPKFQLTDLFYKRKIVLVPLNKGMAGAETARLLGSLIVGLTWTLALSRAGIPEYKRHLVSVYIDELQDYLSLPTDLSDALAQARGLGVGITMAHQYRAQLPPEIRAGIDANARNKICFGLSATDAKEMAVQAPELEALDFMLLPRFEVYANILNHGEPTGWMRGKTFAPGEATNNVLDIRARSQAAYGVPAETVDEEFRKLLRMTDAEPPSDFDDSPIGRRKR